MNGNDCMASIRRVTAWAAGYRPRSATEQDEGTQPKGLCDSLGTSSLNRKVRFSSDVALSPDVPFVPRQERDSLTYPESEVWELSTKYVHSFFRMFSGIHEMRFS